MIETISGNAVAIECPAAAMTEIFHQQDHFQNPLEARLAQRRLNDYYSSEGYRSRSSFPAERMGPPKESRYFQIPSRT